MTEIKCRGSTYIGTAEDEHGLFTNEYGTVYVGEIAGGCASVGVNTWTDGDTWYGECDADGQEHGRVLRCFAGGDTAYYLYEHGSYKERAVLYADGTCKYNGKACRADYAPFLALQATVLPIKARPHQRPYSRPLRRILPPPIGPIGHVLALAGAGDGPRRQGAHLPTPPSACMTLNRYNPQQLSSKCTARPTR